MFVGEPVQSRMGSGRAVCCFTSEALLFLLGFGLYYIERSITI